MGAYGLSAAWKLVQQYRADKSIRYQSIAFAALAGYAFYAQVRPAGREGERPRRSVRMLCIVEQRTHPGYCHA